jgi:nicotinate phosphoribosyltransferase
VADRAPDGSWRGVAKLSPAKSTVPGAKQVFRHVRDGTMVADVVAGGDEQLDGMPVLVPAMRDGSRVLSETLAGMRERAAAALGALPDPLRLSPPGALVHPYPVRHSDRLRKLQPGATADAARQPTPPPQSQRPASIR